MKGSEQFKKENGLSAFESNPIKEYKYTSPVTL